MPGDGRDTRRSFVMGDSLYGHPQHLVRIRQLFAVARDMITLDEFAEFVAESGFSEDTAWQVAGSSRNGRDRTGMMRRRT
jgi:formylglycine-generating enzyme required for sulfatase activity